MSLNLTTYFLETCNIHPLQYSGKIALTYDTRYVRIMIIFRQEQQYGPHLILTPPGHDFRRTNIRLLGSPYTRQNPSPLQPFYNDAPIISP